MSRTVIITGASSGIGEALALRYAREQARLGLLGRHSERLASVADRCRALGSEADTATLDVADRSAMAAWLLDFDRRSPVDILIANAGILAGVGTGPIENPDASYGLMATNVMGLLNAVHPLLPNMVARRTGAIVIVSSVAGFVPLPQMPSYSASKSAILSYGLALRAGLRQHGVQVNVACPGYVSGPMSEQIKGAKPFLVSADHAAEQIYRGIARDKAIIAFPRLLAGTLRILGFLPEAIRSRALTIGRFKVFPRNGRG